MYADICPLDRGQSPVHQTWHSDMCVVQVKSHVDDAVAQGARVVIGGSESPRLPGPYDKGYFFQPTVVADATPSMKIYREETFGPAMPLFKFKYDEEAVKMANDTEYGLAAYFYTKVGLKGALRAVAGFRVIQGLWFNPNHCTHATDCCSLWRDCAAGA